MNCIEFEQNLPDLMYEEDSEAQVHLLSCPHCSGEWEGVKELRAAFKKLPEREPSSVSLQNILCKAALRSPLNFEWGKLFEKLFGWVPQLGLTRTFAPAMVVVLLFVSLLMAVSNNGAQPEKSAWENGTPSFLPQVRKVSLDMGQPSLNSSDLEKTYEERRHALMENDADSLMMQGRRLKTMGHMDMALKDFETIYLFYPGYTYMSDVLMFRAQCYAALGQTDKAVESLQIVAKRYPDKKDIVTPLIEQLSKKNQ